MRGKKKPKEAVVKQFKLSEKSGEDCSWEQQCLGEASIFSTWFGTFLYYDSIMPLMQRCSSSTETPCPRINHQIGEVFSSRFWFFPCQLFMQKHRCKDKDNLLRFWSPHNWINQHRDQKGRNFYWAWGKWCCFTSVKVCCIAVLTLQTLIYVGLPFSTSSTESMLAFKFRWLAGSKEFCRQTQT